MIQGSLDWIESASEMLDESPFAYVVFVVTSEESAIIHSNIDLSEDTEQACIDAIRGHFEDARGA